MVQLNTAHGAVEYSASCSGIVHGAVQYSASCSVIQCMMQWNTARADGLVRKPFEVKHVIQLLDPGEGFAATY